MQSVRLRWDRRLPAASAKAGSRNVEMSVGPALDDDRQLSPLALNTQQPRHQVKIWTSYDFTGMLEGFTLGAGLRLESRPSTTGQVCVVNPITLACTDALRPFEIAQKVYAVGDLLVAYRFNDNLLGGLNVTNITDTRYYQTTGDTTRGNFCGERRAFVASIRTRI